MKYSNKELKREVKTPVDSVVHIIVLIIYAPIRFLSEMGKKIIFLGEYGKICLLGTIILLTALLGINVLYGLLISKVVLVKSGYMSVFSFVVAIALAIGAYLLYCKFYYDIDFDELDVIETDRTIDNIAKAHEDEPSKPVVDSEGTIVDKPEEFEGATFVPEELPKQTIPPKPKENKTLAEIFDSEFDIMDESSIEEILNSTPKTQIDPLYVHEKNEGVDLMLKELLQGMNGRNNPQTDKYEEEQILGKESLAELDTRVTISDKDFEELELTDEEDEELVNHVYKELTGQDVSNDTIANVADSDFVDDFEDLI